MTHTASSTTSDARRRTPAGPAGPTGPTVFVFVLVCLAWANVVGAAEDALTDAAAILDKYVEATGGRAAYEKIHNRVVKGRVVHVGMGFEDPAISFEAEPDQWYFRADSEALGKIERGTDGQVVWYLAANTGPMVEEGTARDAGLREAAFGRVLRWREFYQKAEYVGQEVVDGRTCYKIVMTPIAGEPETRYYDKESNLLVKTKKTRLSSCAGSIPMESTFSDYRPVDGLLIAHHKKRVFQMCGSTREMLFVTDSVEHNVTIPADRFAVPEEIRSLVSQVALRDGPARPQCGQAGCAGGSGCSHGGSGGSQAAALSTDGGQSGHAGQGRGNRPGCGGGKEPASGQGPSKPQQARGGCGSGS